MNNKILFSVIIPVYNAGNKIENSLSIFNKNIDSEIEIIIIDDGSTDNTVEIIKKYQLRNTNIKLFQQKNFGVSSARNYGIKKAIGRYICFLDADDIIDITMFNSLKSIISDNLGIIMFGYKKIKKYDDIVNMNVIISKYFKTNFDDAISEILIGQFGGFVWNKIYDMDTIKKEKIYFDEELSICEDLEFNIRYLMNNKKNIFLTHDIYYYYYQSSNTSFNRYNNLKWFSIIKSLKKLDKLKCNLSRKNNILLTYEEVYNSCLAIAKNKINTKKYKYITEFVHIIENNFVSIIFSPYISFWKKIKLTMFLFFPKTIYKLKQKKMGE